MRIFLTTILALFITITGLSQNHYKSMGKTHLTEFKILGKFRIGYEMDYLNERYNLKGTNYRGCYTLSNPPSHFLGHPLYRLTLVGQMDEVLSEVSFMSSCEQIPGVNPSLLSNLITKFGHPTRTYTHRDLKIYLWSGSVSLKVSYNPQKQERNTHVKFFR